MKLEEQLGELEAKTGHIFRDMGLLEMAMRHSSYTNEKRIPRLDCNERLEFLGDAVLELVSSEFLYERYPQLPEGQLTRMRASLVCEPTLAFDARVLDLGKYLLLGKGEDAGGGRERDSLISDALEATIGAIFLDGGFEEAKKFILRYVMDNVEQKKLFQDSKTALQELLQSRDSGEISYELVSEKGPDHNKQFEVRVKFDGRTLGEGRGQSKKGAEQQAACQAILNIKKAQRV